MDHAQPAAAHGHDDHHEGHGHLTLSYHPGLPLPNAKLFMWLFLSTEIMFFAALIGTTPVNQPVVMNSAGVRRVVQISALGIDGSDTRYAQTKRAAETHLQTLAAQGALRPAILRPIVRAAANLDRSTRRGALWRRLVDK